MTTHIIVVDDDPVVGILVNEFLARHGFHIELLTSGSACLARLQEISPDILLLDLQMPDMSGIEVLKKIRASAKTKALPVIMMSADSDADTVVSSNNCHADFYLEKPFEPRQIFEAITSLIEQVKRTSP